MSEVIAQRALPIVSVEEAIVHFPVAQSIFEKIQGKPRKFVQALNGVRLDLLPGETLGVVGESGCGKSTLARTMVGLLQTNEGKIYFNGKDIATLRGKARRSFNRQVQMIFQDPYSSLNPRMTVGQVLTEALSVHNMCPKEQIPARIRELMTLVRLPLDAIDKLPHEFSGGQRQRIGISRALAVEPQVLIADELVSALDVSVQAQVVNLLLDLQQKLNLTVLFVAHDLRLVRHISHRVAVMYLGEVVEVADTETLFNTPLHPYTQALLRAAPSMDPCNRGKNVSLMGELPSPLSPPSGCRFHTRCPYVTERCRIERPVLATKAEGQRVACHLAPVESGA
ncbi:ABC transporter ATP-binding protein [Pantoea phytobeneficialis]|uniref:ATP-binding cassette domain-containing protein n=1 Tax=Pantoea phytobeneficialis TaxID=2052056 RepID=A0AAP9H6V9_9GAMM|nr:oligopeptide/dipeptide ABC transporter ATP-binding protein [Pantoea phytobeneficialis]MDO6408932.1 ATP-binding cassette domain-containing protein [Pantoea phytobeneficialis]QGR07434.1 peptide ABC transporter ATP-binding protein [Pantoea phytobeneficialis]